MKKSLIAIAASALLTISAGAFASNPTSITFESEGTTPDGAEYANYIVKCSNGQRMPLTAWEQRRKWCVGQESQEECYKKQIKAAKEACKAG